MKIYVTFSFSKNVTVSISGYSSVLVIFFSSKFDKNPQIGYNFEHPDDLN